MTFIKNDSFNFIILMKIHFSVSLTLLCLMAAVQASRLPVFTRGAYLLLADDTMWVKNDQGQSVNSDSGNWNPKLSSWIHSFNVVFFAFINHEMQVPPSFENARTSG